MKRVALTLLLAAGIGLAACRNPLPLLVPAEPTPATAPSAPDVMPPPDWCGTGGTDRLVAMDERRASGPDGEWTRLSVRHTDQGWALVTERGRFGRAEVTRQESPLPGGVEGRPDAAQVRTWLLQLGAREEESVFRAALALGAHRVQAAGGPLRLLLESGSLAGRERTWRNDGEAEVMRYGVVAAALALGEIGSPDAVKALISEGLWHEEELIRAAVEQALNLITGHQVAAPDAPAEPSTPDSTRRRLQTAWSAWWAGHEGEVRSRAQPSK